MPRKKGNKPLAYAWVAYMMTHQPDEMKRVLKYGTPSNDLIKLSEQPVGMTLKDGKYKMIVFPVSLNTRAGQKLLFEAVTNVSKHLQTIPVQAYERFQEIKTTLSNRRKDTLSNYLMVAEAICHRAAFEFKHEILFAYDSILSWVKSAYDKDLGYLTVRRALEALQDAGFIKVREWGKRGNRSKCTKIELTCSPRKHILTYTSKVDAWLMDNDPAMFTVYARENTTRLDVLEQKFHHFADEVAQEESRFAEGYRLFSATDDRLIEAGTGSADLEIIGVLDELYIDRLLGGLVPTLQENGSDYRQSSSALRQPGTG
jgi:hypothetical protein